MRLWSVHPRYLDVSGLTACWREGLLARKVLREETRGYRNHPQLLRFKASDNPGELIDAYLWCICEEARNRGYRFDSTKINAIGVGEKKLSVTRGQLEYEFLHLLNKLRVRMPAKYDQLVGTIEIEPHPLFHVIEGNIASWEVVK